MKSIKKIFVISIIVIIGLFFLDNVSAEPYNNYSEDFESCGDGYMDRIPVLVPKVVSVAYTIIQIAVPITLVIMGTLDLLKGITAQKEDEIKKGQQMFIKRLIVAALVFFAFVIIKVVISFVADSSSAKVIECAQCFIEKKCDR